VPEAWQAILEEPIAVRGNGTVSIPQEPGLGLRIDQKKLRRHGKRFYKMNTVKLAVHTIRKKGLKTALELKKKKLARAKTGD
jgi:hypothetical protein